MYMRYKKRIRSSSLAHPFTITPTVNMFYLDPGSDKSSGCGVLAINSGTWSDWVHTTKTATGSWAVADHEKLCNNYTTLRIECNTTDGEKAETTGELFDCDKDLGFVCKNIEQDSTTCSNYKFRLRCSATKKIGKF